MFNEIYHKPQSNLNWTTGDIIEFPTVERSNFKRNFN